MQFQPITKANEILERKNYAIILVYSSKLPNPARVKIDKSDIQKVKKYKWYINTSGNRIEIAGYINKKWVKLSRFILGYNGNLLVDHINRNTLDNRKSNLRIVTAAVNCQNRKDDCGIFKLKNGTWNVKLLYYGVRYTVGTFPTKEEAEEAKSLFVCKLKAKEEELKKQYEAKGREKYIRPINDKWVLYIRNKKIVYRKTFNTKEEAIAKRDELLREKGDWQHGDMFQLRGQRPWILLVGRETLD